MYSRKLRFLLVALFSVAISTAMLAQPPQDKAKRPSPPAQATASMGDLTVTIDYSAPAVKGRTIWGNLVSYNKVWRTGANEATTFEINQDVKIAGETLTAGKYALFTIPTEDEWTFIFNKEADQWGSYNYKESEDALRITAKPGKTANFAERMNFEIVTKGTQSGWVTLNWENLSVGFPVENTGK